jgi:serine/threonine protein kinase
MWSLGILTLCLLTGDAPITFEELQKMSQDDVAALLVHSTHFHPQWRDVNVHGKDFVRKLLVLDPGKRMTAKEAIQHDWFRKPAKVAAGLDSLYERANKFWSKRPSSRDIIEELVNITELRIRNPMPVKIPDATASPFFSLDRHIQSSGTLTRTDLQSNRRRLLEGLKEADSHFVDALKQVPASTTAKPKTKAKSPLLPLLPLRTKSSIGKINDDSLLILTTRKRRSIPEDTTNEEAAGKDSRRTKLRRLESESSNDWVVKEVDANDMFGTPIELRAAEAAEAAYDDLSPHYPFQDEPDTDLSVLPHTYLREGPSPPETCLDELSPNNPFSLGKEVNERPSLPESFDELSPHFQSSLVTAIVEDSLERPSLPRSYTITEEDRELHDEVVKQLPKVTTAKAFSHAIAQKKKSRAAQETESPEQNSFNELS